jgi:hypothetical protein
MEKLKLKDHPYCKCYVLKDDDIIKLVSYIKEVIIAVRNPKNKNEWFLKCTGTYSRTTRKQISWFLREYFPKINYFDMKEIAGKETFLIYDEEIGKIS